MAQFALGQWSPDTQANTPTSTLCRDVSPELDEVDSFPTPIPRPQQLPLRIPSLIPALAKLDALYDPEDHMNTREEYDLNDTMTEEGAAAYYDHNVKRMAYVQLSAQRLQAATGMCNANTFNLPLDTPKRVIPPAGLMDGYKPIPVTPLAAHSSSLFGPPIKGAPQEDTRRAARVIRKKDSGIGLNGQTTPVPIGLEVIDKKTGKGLREFMLAKGKEHGMRKREAKEISFWDFTTNLRTCVPKQEQLFLYDVTEPGDRIDVYEIDLPTTSHNLATGSEVRGTETWLWILIQRQNVVAVNPYNSSTIPEGRPWPDEDKDPPVPVVPPNFPRPPPSPWMVIAAPLAHLTVYPEIVESPPTSSNTLATRLLKNQKSKLASGSGRKVQKRIDYDFSHSGVPLFEFSMQFQPEVVLNPSSIPYLSVEGIGTWYDGDPYEKLTLDEWDIAQAGFREYVENLAVDDPVRYNAIFDARLDGTAVENRGFGVVSPFKGVWWMEFYNGMYANASRWRNVKKTMSRGECRVVVRWTEWECDWVDDMEIEKLLADALTQHRTRGLVGPPLNLIGMGMNSQETHQTRSRSRCPSRLSIDDGTLPAAEKCLAADEAIGIGLGISFGTGVPEKCEPYLSCF